MRKLTAMILMVLLTTTCLFSEPLTDEEVLSYWGSLTKVERIDEIRKLDNIENAIPTISIPPLTAVLSGADLYISYEATLEGRQGLYINIADALEYRVEMEGVKVADFVPFEIEPYLITGGACLLVGLVAGLLIPR